MKCNRLSGGCWAASANKGSIALLLAFALTFGFGAGSGGSNSVVNRVGASSSANAGWGGARCNGLMLSFSGLRSISRHACTRCAPVGSFPVLKLYCRGSGTLRGFRFGFGFGISIMSESDEDITSIGCLNSSTDSDWLSSSFFSISYLLKLNTCCYSNKYMKINI